VDRLIREVSLAERDRRSVHRTAFVRPVTVQILGGGDKSLLAFSKNISPVGMGLILEEARPEGTMAILSIQTFTDRDVQIRSELRWCEPFGNGWSISGWKFITEVHG
jgi:hypothetical protein